MNVVVTGSRSLAPHPHLARWIFGELDRIHAETPITRIAHGGAAGPDKMASRWAEERGVESICYRPDYRDPSNARYAPLLRNIRMLSSEKPDLVVAFWNGISNGTAHTIDEAKRRGFQTRVFLDPDTEGI